MALEQSVLDGQRVKKPVGKRRRLGLKSKIAVGMVVGLMLFGSLGFVLVSREIGEIMRRQLDRRALDIATNLGDAAASHMLRRNRLELHALVSKYSLLSGVAYVFISDRQGRIVAHSLGAFPPELKQSLLPKEQREAGQRELVLRGRQVFETHAPILDGQAGTVYVSIWADTLDGEIRSALLPITGVMVILLLAISVFSFLIAKKIIQPVLRLKDIADKISMGELETAVGIDSNDEIGDLALSLDRMRSSLKAAMMRLKRA